MKSKYLFVTPWCPFPPHKNGGIHTTYNILLNKPEKIPMDLFYYAEQDLAAEKVINELVDNIYYQELFTVPGKKERIHNFFSGKPDLLSGMKCNRSSVIDFGKYDVIILDQILSLPLLNCVPKDKKIIAMMHDNHILMYQRKTQMDSSYIKKVYDRMQCEFYKRYEQVYYEFVEKIIYVSSLDADYSKKIHPEYKHKFDNITLGVDLPSEDRISKPINEHSLVFSGVMDYGPNEDAALFFAKDIFPEILKVYPDCTLTIAGKNPTNAVCNLKNNNITVTGYVDDIISTITKSSIYISPLRYGSGTKNKVLEAMSAGMPVLLSSVSMEGIDGLKDGSNCIYVGENEWSPKIIKLLDSPDTRNKIAVEGKKYVEENHSWRRIFDKFII